MVHRCVKRLKNGALLVKILHLPHSVTVSFVPAKNNIDCILFKHIYHLFQTAQYDSAVMDIQML